MGNKFNYRVLYGRAHIIRAFNETYCGKTTNSMAGCITKNEPTCKVCIKMKKYYEERPLLNASNKD